MLFGTKPRSYLLMGLDVGTSEIKALVVKRGQNSDLETLAFSREPMTGMRRGVVVDSDKVSDVLNNVLEGIQTQLDRRINSSYVNIGGSHLFCTLSHGTVAVSRADKKISEEDVDRVLEAAQAFSLPSNKEILDIYPWNFIVDGEKVKKPIGMEGVRLEAEALVICGFSPYCKNLTRVVLGSDVQIQELIPGPVAAARACLSPRQKELGVALLDIGAGTSGLAVYEEGNLIHMAILPIGSANITNDVAIGLRVDIDLAEKIKKEFGSCVLSKKERREKFVIAEPEQQVFTRKKLTNIIEARVAELFEQVNKELKKISKEALLPAGVVLTGGGAKIPKITELAKKEFKLPCRIGKPRGIMNLENDPTLSTVCGLILEGADLKGGGRIPVVGLEIKSKFKKFFKIFVP